MENKNFKFSRPPVPNLNSRPSANSFNELPAEVQLFKDTYIQERRVLERFRQGSDVSVYQPASSLDGKSKFDSVEERKTTNQWQAMYKKLRQLQHLEPTNYVRILFYILRGSALAVPTLKQLASPKTIEMVLDGYQKIEDDLRWQFLAESQRIKTAIVISQKGDGYPLSLAVYYALTDSRLELSPLFRYCIAASTCVRLLQSDKKDPHIKKLDKIAKQFEFLAAMDYTLFPRLYDAVLGKIIPADFCVAAADIVSAAR